MKRLTQKPNSLTRSSGIPLSAPTPPPAPRRWPRVAAVLFIYGAVAILLALGFFDALSTAPTDVDNAVDNSPFAPSAPAPLLTTTPLASDYVLLQPDRVAVDGERLALELERDRISSELSAMDQRIAQADEQQQLALIRQQQQLEIDRTAIDLKIRDWDANRERLLADARADAEAVALAVTAESQQAQAIREMADARTAEAIAEARASIGTAASYIIIAVIATWSAGITLLVLYVVVAAVYARVSFDRPALRPSTPLPDHSAPTPAPSTDPALAELYELMREIERRTTPPVPTPQPQREPVRRRTPPAPVTDENQPVTDTVTRGSHSVSDEVSDIVTDNDEPLLNASEPLSAADKRRILSAYHRHNAAVTPASRAVFGYANVRTNNIIRAVVEELTAGQGE